MALAYPNIHLVDLELTKNKYGHHQMGLAKSQTVNNKCMFTFQRPLGKVRIISISPESLTFLNFAWFIPSSI